MLDSRQAGASHAFPTQPSSPLLQPRRALPAARTTVGVAVHCYLSFNTQ